MEQIKRSFIPPRFTDNSIVKNITEYTSKFPKNNYYDLSTKNLGVVLIFNQTKFEHTLCKRNESSKDVIKLKATLKNMHFQDNYVHVYTNLRKLQILMKLDEVANEDHTNNASLLVIIMTLGEDEGSIYASDRSFSVDELWSGFNERNCPSLCGKPKLFFVQAIKEESFNLTTCSMTFGRSTSFVIPTQADILLMYSTIQASSNDGSLFIQALCNQLDEYHESTDIMTILTLVVGKMACNTDKHKLLLTTQLPHINSQLTKILYFGKVLSTTDYMSSNHKLPNKIKPIKTINDQISDDTKYVCRNCRVNNLVKL